MNKLRSLGMLIALTTTTIIADQESPKVYFLNKQPYLSPRIIKELSTLISDAPNHAQVVSLDVLECQNSNRFHGPITISKGDAPKIVSTDYDNGAYFSYIFIGKTRSGNHILLTRSSGGGTLVETEIMIVEFITDHAYKLSSNTLTRSRQRLTIKRTWGFSLGDRYLGNVFFDGNELHISKDKNSYSNLISEDIVIKIRQ
jgi:hypothetical protein